MSKKGIVNYQINYCSDLTKIMVAVLPPFIQMKAASKPKAVSAQRTYSLNEHLMREYII